MWALALLLCVEARVLVAHSSESKANAVKDYYKDIEAVKAEILTADGDNSVLAVQTTQALEEKFSRFTELENKMISNADQSAEESNVVADTVAVTTVAAETSLNTAQKMLETQESNQGSQKIMINQIEQDARAGVSMLQGGAEMGIMVDESEFGGVYANTVAQGASKDRTVKGLLDRANMKFSAKTGSLESKYNLFVNGAEDMQFDAKEFASQSAVQAKEAATELKNARNNLEDLFKDTAKVIATLPLDEKVINSQEMDRNIGRADTDIEGLIKEATSDGDEGFEETTKYAVEAYKKVGEAAEKAGSDYHSLIQGYIKADGTLVGKALGRAEDLGDEIKDLTKDVKATTKAIGKDASVFGAEIKGELTDSLGQEKITSEKLTKDAGARMSGAQQEIDGVAAQVSATIGESTTDLASSSASSTDKLDQTVQEASMSTSSDEANMQAAVGQRKRGATALASSVSATDAEIQSSEASGSKTVTAVKKHNTKAEFDLKVKLSELEQEIKGGAQTFAVATNGAIDGLAAQVSSEVPKVEQPVWAALQKTLRSIGTLLDAAKVQQVTDLGGLETKLKEVSDIMARNSGKDQTTQVEIPNLKSEAKAEMDRLTSYISSMEEDRDRVEHEVKQNSELTVLETTNGINDELTTMRSSLRETLGDRTRSLFAQLDVLQRMIKNVEGDNVANAEETTESHNFLQQKVEGLETELSNAQAKQNQQIQAADAKVHEITGVKIQELNDLAQKAIRQATDYVSQQVAAMKMKSVQEVTDDGVHLDQQLAEVAAMTKTKLSDKGAAIKTAFASNVDVMSKAVEEEHGKAESLKFAAIKATDDAETSLSGLERTATGLTQEAERVVEATKNRVENVKKDTESMHAVMRAETDSVLTSAKRSIGGEEESVDGKLQEGLQGLESAGDGEKASWQAAIDKVDAQLSNQAALTKEAGDAAEAGAKSVSDDFEKRSEVFRDGIKDAESKEANAAADIEDVVSTLEDTSLFDRDKAVLAAMKEGSGDIQNERDMAADEIKNSVKAEVNMIQTQNKAIFTEVDSEVRQAAAKQEKSEAELAAEEKSLWNNASALDQHRMLYENDTIGLLSQFNKRVDDEEKSLGDNTVLLDKYERLAHQRELAIVEKTVELLKHVAVQSDAKFDEMEQREQVFGDDISKMMGGEVFGTLGKIMETDQYVQQVDNDGEYLINYLTRHEETSTPWMNKVMSGLDTIHDEMKAAEAAGADATSKKDAAQRERTEKMLGNLEGLVQASGGGQLGELQKMADGSSEMLKNSQAASDARDHERMNAMMGENNANIAEDNEKITTEKAEFHKTQDLSQKTDQQISGMNDDVQKLLNYNANIVADEKARLQERSEKVSNGLFSGPADSQASLIESGPTHARHHAKLAALLEENAKLSTENKKLSVEQQKLGTQVTHIANQLRSA